MISSRRKPTAWVESWTLPGRFFSRRMWPGLGEVGQQRIVARVLPMMGIEAAEGPADRRAGADHGAIDVDREPRQREPADRVRHDLVVQLTQRGQRRPRELPEPVAHRARRRNSRQAAEAAHQGIAGDVPQMLRSAAADVEERQDQQAEPGAAVVAPHRGQRSAESAGQIDPLQIPTQQFQPTVGRQLLRHELDGQIALDHSVQARYAQPHQRGLQCVGSDVGAFSLKSALGASLIHFDRSLMPERVLRGLGGAGRPLAHAEPRRQGPRAGGRGRRAARRGPEGAAGRAPAAGGPLRLPGPRLMTQVHERLQTGDWTGFARLVQRISGALLTNSYRDDQEPWKADEEGGGPRPTSCPPSIGRGQGRRPYFEILFVSPAERAMWPEIRETFRRLRRAEDEFVYEPVVVGSFEDAVLAVVFNPNLQAVVISDGFGYPSQYTVPVLREILTRQVQVAESARRAISGPCWRRWCAAGGRSSTSISRPTATSPGWPAPPRRRRSGGSSTGSRSRWRSTWRSSTA